MKKIIITENQSRYLINELIGQKLIDKFRIGQSNPEAKPAELNFKLKYPNRIDDREYMRHKNGNAVKFDKKEIIKLGLLTGEWKPAFLNQYDFRYTRKNFGEPTVIIKASISKYMDYYLINLIYTIKLQGILGTDVSYGVFLNFKSLIKFLEMLKTTDLLSSQDSKMGS
jgi:hypothetical protein